MTTSEFCKKKSYVPKRGPKWYSKKGDPVGCLPLLCCDVVFAKIFGTSELTLDHNLYLVPRSGHY